MKQYKVLTAGQIIDQTFFMFRTGFFKFLKIGIVFSFISLFLFSVYNYLCIYIFNINITNSTEIISSITKDPYSFLKVLPVYLIYLILSIIIYCIYMIIYNDFYQKLYLEKKWNLKESLNLAKKLIFKFMGANFFFFLFLLCGFVVCCIGFVPMLTFSYFIIPVIIFEKKKVFAAIGRSFSMGVKNFWSITGNIWLFALILFGFYLILGIIIIAIGYLLLNQSIFGRLPTLNLDLLNDQNKLFSYNVAIELVSSLFSLIIISLVTCFNIILYYNHLIKFESFGVQQQTEDYLDDKVEMHE